MSDTDIVERMIKYAERFEKIDKPGHGEVIRGWAAELQRLRSGRAAVMDKRYERLLGSFAELQAAAQFVVNETDRIHDNDSWPIKYRAAYGAITKLRDLLGRQYGLRSLAGTP